MILLIQPISKESGKLNYPPFGLMSVAARPVSKGESVKILDENILGREKIKSEIRRSRLSIVGFTTFTGPMLKDALELSWYVKKKTDALVVLGGVHASTLPYQTLKKDCVDIVVVGEGDNVFYEVIKNRDNLDKVKGIIYKNHTGEIIENEPSGLIPDLAGLPATPWHLIEVEKYYVRWAGVDRTIPLITSRGCLYNCIFCYNKEFNRRRWRHFNLERVFSEIDLLVDKPDIQGIRLDASDNFVGTDKVRAIKIMRYLKSKGMRFSFQTRVHDLDKPFLDKMKANGYGYIFFGLESGSPGMQTYLNKPFDTESVIELVHYANRIGLRCGAGFVFDIPGETDTDFKMTRNLIKRLNCLIQINAIQPFPGTELYEDIEKWDSFAAPGNTLEWQRFTWGRCTASQT